MLSKTELRKQRRAITQKKYYEKNKEKMREYQKNYRLRTKKTPELPSKD